MIDEKIIQEFMPCQACGNTDLNYFYLHIFQHWGSQPYVLCSKCKKEYYSKNAKKIMKNVLGSNKLDMLSNLIPFKKMKPEFYIGFSDPVGSNDPDRNFQGIKQKTDIK